MERTGRGSTDAPSRTGQRKSVSGEREQCFREGGSGSETQPGSCLGPAWEPSTTLTPRLPKPGLGSGQVDGLVSLVASPSSGEVVDPGSRGCPKEGCLH